MDKIVFSFLFLVLFLPLSFSQTNNPREKERREYSNITNSCSTKEVTILPWSDYPFGVCLGSQSELTPDQEQWTRIAMEMWNQKYEEYLSIYFTRGIVIGLPNSPLFVESCNKEKHNIIYFERRAMKALASYTPWNVWYDFEIFYSIIRVNKNTDWGDGFYFVNVMVHELGHAVALTHDEESKTEIMVARGFGGSCKSSSLNTPYKKRYCSILDYDIKRFLESYSWTTYIPHDEGCWPPVGVEQPCL